MRVVVAALLVFAAFCLFMGLSSFFYEQELANRCVERGGVPYHSMCFKKDALA